MLTATAAATVVVYYCKAGLSTGKTVRVTQGRDKHSCSGVRLTDATAEMIHGNSTGPAKASGARCVLIITSGTVAIVP